MGCVVTVLGNRERLYPESNATRYLCVLWNLSSSQSKTPECGMEFPLIHFNVFM